MKDGEVGTGNNSHARWCASCNRYHGILHVCPNYSAETVARLQDQQARHMAWLASPLRQLDTDPTALAVFRVFAGLC